NAALLEGAPKSVSGVGAYGGSEARSRGAIPGVVAGFMASSRARSMLGGPMRPSCAAPRRRESIRWRPRPVGGHGIGTVPGPALATTGARALPEHGEALPGMAALHVASRDVDA